MVGHLVVLFNTKAAAMARLQRRAEISYDSFQLSLGKAAKSCTAFSQRRTALARLLGTRPRIVLCVWRWWHE